ncbi:MAG: HD domain-containing protein, partial [Candidatus Nezhaarchaeota archaeon]|nr:HD domain-containing protein [Candidatus Nezhaarchaeota archaeon]
MSSLYKACYEPPMYPAYKAFFVPLREGGALVDAREVRAEDVAKWAEALERLRGFLRSSLDYVERMRGRLDEAESLELLCDLTALFFRLPLVREPLPSVAPSPLKAYLFYRLSGLSPPKDFLDFTYSFYDEMVREKFLELAIAKALDDPELHDLIEACWFSLPADTRPAFNTGGLIPHLLLTSSLAWALAVSKGLDREGATLLRLTAMLHDAGKPLSYADHVKASAKVCEFLLSGLVPNVQDLVSFVQRHHARAKTDEAEILSEADSCASAMDRLRELADATIGPRVEGLARELGLDALAAYDIGPRSWGFWTKLNEARPGLIKELSELFVREVRTQTQGFLKLPAALQRAGDSVKGVELALVDVGNIQSFIMRCTELRCVAAASLAIDALVMAHIPLSLQHAALKEHWIPFESVLYTAGGIVEALLPSELVKYVASKIEEVEREASKHGVLLRFASAPLTRSFIATLLKLARA